MFDAITDEDREFLVLDIRTRSYIGFTSTDLDLVERMKQFIEQNKCYVREEVMIQNKKCILIEFWTFIQSGISVPSWYKGEIIEYIKSPKFVVIQPLERREFDLQGRLDYVKGLYDCGFYEKPVDDSGWTYSRPHNVKYGKIHGKCLNAFSYYPWERKLDIHLDVNYKITLDLGDPRAVASARSKYKAELNSFGGIFGMALLIFCRRNFSFPAGSQIELFRMIWVRSLQKQFIDSLRPEARWEKK